MTIQLIGYIIKPSNETTNAPQWHTPAEIRAAAAEGLRIDYNFRCVDNGGKHQAFTVSAPNKAAAIEKALKKAEKNAAGDICGRWEIKLQPSF